MIYELKPEQTALLVIDVQEEYFDRAGPASFPEASARLGAINELIGCFQDLGAAVIYIRHCHRTSGADVGRMGDFSSDGEEDSFVEGGARVGYHQGLLLVDSPIEVTKSRYDSFQGTDLNGILRTLGATTVVICGYMTSFCCDTTARSAHGRDYATVFALDAVGGPDLEHLDASIYPSAEVLEDVASALAAGFAEVLTVQEIITRISIG